MGVVTDVARSKRISTRDPPLTVVHVINIYSNRRFWLYMVGICVHVYTDTVTILHVFADLVHV